MQGFYYLSLQYTGIPGWILVAFRLTKCSIWELPPRLLKSKLFQWSIVSIIVLIHILLYIELLISLRLEPFYLDPKIYVCNFPTLSYFYPFLYTELAETCVIPFLIMIMTSTITIRLLLKSRQSLEEDMEIWIGTMWEEFET